jgi:hypothetical protein
MGQLEQEWALGKQVKVILDSDHSGKEWSVIGKIVHVFTNPPAKEAIAVEFEPGALKGLTDGLFRRTKDQYLILEYPLDRPYTLAKTLTSGSFAMLLKPKRPDFMTLETYSREEASCEGFAEVIPLPSNPT